MIQLDTFILSPIEKHKVRCIERTEKTTTQVTSNRGYLCLILKQTYSSQKFFYITIKTIFLARNYLVFNRDSYTE